MAASGAKQVRLNPDTNFLKLVGCIAMVVDHAGKMLFPQVPMMRIIGRLAFPIFAYCMAVGCIYTHDMRKYVLRVLILALVTQPIYVLALGHTTAAMNAISFAKQPLQAAGQWYVQSFLHPSILISLLAGMMIIWSLKEEKYIATALMTLLVWYFQSRLDYGWKGVALMVLFYALCDRPLASFVWVGGFMAWWGLAQGGGYNLWGLKFSIQLYAMVALPAIYLPTNTRVKLPKWFFYAFYPGHLLLIYLLNRFAF